MKKKVVSKIDQIINLVKADRALKKSPQEERLIETRQRIDAVYYSNKYEGNKLSKKEAVDAMLIK